MAEHGRLQRYYEHDWYQDDDDRNFDNFGAPHPAEAGLRYHDVRQWLSDNGFNGNEWHSYTRDARVRVENAEPTPWGAPRPLDDRSLWRQFQQVTGIPDLATPLNVAAKASIDPAGFGPHTRVQVTAYSRSPSAACARAITARSPSMRNGSIPSP